MRAYSATVGATDGNIIAAIITTQTPTNQPSPPRLVHGPPSMPRISRAVQTHPTAATANSAATRPSRARAAAYPGRSPAGRPTSGGAPAVSVMRSGGPGELGLRQTRLAFVGDAEGVDPRPFRLRHREVGPDRVEHAVEPDRLPGLDPERHDVLDLEVDGVTDLHAVPQAVVVHLYRRPLDPEDLAHERRQRAHRSAELSAEDLGKLVELVVRRLVVDEHAEAPVALSHDLRGVRDHRNGAPADVGALDVAVTDTEDQRHPAEVVGRTVVERQVARTHQLARTRLDVASGQVPGHGGLPSGGRSLCLPSADRQRARSGHVAHVGRSGRAVR